MALYAACIATTVTTSGQCSWSIRKGIPGARPRLLEFLYATTNFSTAAAYGICRPFTPGTATSSWTPIALDDGDPAPATRVETAWSVNPSTFTPTYFHRWRFPGIGYVISFTYPRGLAISTSLVCVNINTVVTYYASFVLDE